MSFGSRTYDAAATARGWWHYGHFTRKFPKRDPEFMRAFQFNRLRELLIDAQHNVPYYRQRFRESGFEPRTDFRSLDDLRNLPILTKSEARASANKLVRQPLPSGSLCVSTSGSTGEPFQVWVSPGQIAVEKATVWRHWRWLGYRFRDRMAILRTYVPKAGQPLWKLDRSRNFLYLSAYHLNQKCTQLFFERLKNFRPAYLRGYPSALATLARFALEANFKLSTSPNAILTASETLLDEQRELIEQAFHAPVRDWYGLAEQVVTANQCACGQGYCLNEDYGYAELVPREDRSLTGSYRLVGTNLTNSAMPLIRYDTGDLVEPTDVASCDCGIHLTRLARIRGRQDDELVTRDGRRLPAVNFYSVFRDHQWIRRFQVVQHKDNAVTVRLDAQQVSQQREDELMDAVVERLGKGTKVTITRSESFARSSDGKHRVVISHVSNSQKVNLHNHLANKELAV